MARNPLENQIPNRNFLSPIGFKFTLAKTPKVDFFCNSARIPEITLGTAIQPSYLKDIDVPGDKLQYGDLSLRFLVDEEMENYMSIHNWLVGLGFPETAQQFKDLTTETNQNSNRFGDEDRDLAFSDASLYILNSNYRTTGIVKFQGLFPVSLTSLDFEATDTDINYFTAEATFKYTIFNILDKNASTEDVMFQVIDS